MAEGADTGVRPMNGSLIKLIPSPTQNLLSSDRGVMGPVQTARIELGVFVLNDWFYDRFHVGLRGSTDGDLRGKFKSGARRREIARVWMGDSPASPALPYN